LECGSLLPLLFRELARGGFGITAHYGQQAGLKESGSKLPHSKKKGQFALAFSASC
jgi:hypothetical protein